MDSFIQILTKREDLDNYFNTLLAENNRKVLSEAGYHRVNDLLTPEQAAKKLGLDVEKPNWRTQLSKLSNPNHHSNPLPIISIKGLENRYQIEDIEKFIKGYKRERRIK